MSLITGKKKDEDIQRWTNTVETMKTFLQLDEQAVLRSCRCYLPEAQREKDQMPNPKIDIKQSNNVNPKMYT